MRHVTGWNVDSVVEEYRAYAEPKAREQDMKYIKEYQVADLEGLFTDSIHGSHNAALSKPKMARMAIFAAIVMLIVAATAFFW
jgi:tyrosine-protein phosphatase SIW14